MHIALKKIPQTDYNIKDLPILFEDKLTDRAFGIIFKNDVAQYKLGWQSDSLDPIVVTIDKNICIIGIDQKVIFYNISDGNILLEITLTFLLYDIKIHNNFAYIISELEILKTSINSFTIVEVISLPDYYKQIKFINTAVEIECLEGQIVRLNE